jgi:hypothetical protein
MDDPFRVSRGKSMGDLDPDFHGRVLGKRARREPLTQRLTFEQLGDDVVDAVCLADVVEGEDVGVRERSDGPRFALETGRSMSWAKSDGRTLTATSRPSRVSRAR